MIARACGGRLTLRITLVASRGFTGDKLSPPIKSCCHDPAICWRPQDSDIGRRSIVPTIGCGLLVEPVFRTDLSRGFGLLRPTSEFDLDFIAGLEEEVGESAGRPWTVSEHRAVLREEDSAHFIIEIGGHDVGFAILRGKSRPDGCIEILRLLVRGRLSSLYQRSIFAIAHLAFDEWFADKLRVDPAAWNSELVASLRDFGFTDEGIQDLSTDAAQSNPVMSILAVEYERDWKPHRAFQEVSRSGSVLSLFSRANVSDVPKL
jgi:hypothetical protein